MILPLADDQNIVLQVFIQHKPASSVSAAADAKTLALSQRIIGKPDMLPNRFPCLGLHLSGNRRQIVLQKRAEIPLADETDARGILFCADGQPMLLCKLTHLAFGHPADGETQPFAAAAL